MSLSAALVLGLSLVAAEPKADPKAEAPKPYTLDTAGTTAQLGKGGKGVFKLQIKPAQGYHVSDEAPLKITLSAAGLSLAKQTLGHGDKDQKKTPAPKFEVGFGADEAGKRTIEADALFFVCSEEACERKTEKLTVAVDVKP